MLTLEAANKPPDGSEKAPHKMRSRAIRETCANLQWAVASFQRAKLLTRTEPIAKNTMMEIDVANSTSIKVKPRLENGGRRAADSETDR
jgi:hypothetical protein